MGTVSEHDDQERRRTGSGGAKQHRVHNALGNEKGVAEGSGSVAGWNENVDRLLDASPRFTGAVRAAYSHFCLPPPSPFIPPALLLPALQYFLERIIEDLDEKAGKVCLRPATEDDIDVISRNDETLARQRGHLIDFSTFDRYARHLLKRVALDRGKRLGLFMLGGVLVVHMTKSAVRKIPFLGGPIGAFLNALVPTAIAGPVVGVAGAMYL